MSGQPLDVRLTIEAATALSAATRSPRLIDRTASREARSHSRTQPGAANGTGLRGVDARGRRAISPAWRSTRQLSEPFRTDGKGTDLDTYRIHISSDEFHYESEVRASSVEKEDGWTIFWNGNDVFMRIREEHIVSLEHLI